MAKCIVLASLCTIALGSLPEDTEVSWPGSKCSGSEDPKGSYPMCYEGSAGALGVKEDVKVKLVSYANGKGTLDLEGSGIESITCKGKAFTKSGQEISPDISDCLPKVIAVQKVEYCSDSDTVSVTVKDSKVPIPVSATLKKVTCAGLDVGANSLPAWLPIAGLGFLEGFLSEKSDDLDTCIAGSLTPVSDIETGISDIKKGIKEFNLTDIAEGVASLHKLMQDMPAAMKSCHAAETDVKAIIDILKSFKSLQDIITHIESDFDADTQGQIAAEFELMVRSFEGKNYRDFGNHAGQLLHLLVVGPESTVVGRAESKCSGSEDPKGSYPMCYEGSAGNLGVEEDVKVKLVSYANGKGTMDLEGSGLESVTCKGKAFTKREQEISPDISDCLPEVITVQKIEYCSDSDTVSVTLEFPVSATLKKVTCPSASVVV